MSATWHMRRLDASREAVWAALTDPTAIAQWRYPDGMRCEVHAFEPREGGAFRVSLTYEGEGVGKSGAKTDTYAGTFTGFDPPNQLVEVLAFETDDPDMQGEMTITTTLTDVPGGTLLTGVHSGLPAGVSPADNDAGWSMALERLGLYLAG